MTVEQEHAVELPEGVHGGLVRVPKDDPRGYWRRRRGTARLSLEHVIDDVQRLLNGAAVAEDVDHADLLASSAATLAWRGVELHVGARDALLALERACRADRHVAEAIGAELLVSLRDEHYDRYEGRVQ